MKRSALWLAAAGLIVLGLPGCTASPTIPTPPAASTGEAPPSDSACEHTLLTLQATPSSAEAGETVTVKTTPERCPVTHVWEGELIVRLDSRDTPTGSRIETGSTQPIVVTIPSGLTGDGYIMLDPDRDCEPIADCYFPFANIRIEAPTR